MTPEQRRNAAIIRQVGQQMGASKKAIKAALEAGITESNLRNLNYGDRDSVGVFQQRPSQGWKGLTNVSKAAKEFYAQAIPKAQKYGTAGQLAQAVQRSAYPERYDQHSAEADALLKGTQLPGRKVGYQAPKPTSVGSVGADAKTAIALSLLGMGNLAGGYGNDDLTTSLIQAAQQQKAPKAVRKSQSSATTPSYTGTTTFDGKPVAAWIAPILKEARRTGLWKGSVNSGVRSKSEQLAAAKRYGLQHYPHGPLASNHVEGHPGAVDVSDPEGLKRALRKLGVKRLKSSMPEDPVHFSQTGY